DILAGRTKSVQIDIAILDFYFVSLYFVFNCNLFILIYAKIDIIIAKIGLDYLGFLMDIFSLTHIAYGYENFELNMK
ncbi:hypothetical protein, partial [Peptostreptococcus sp.]|uniref:hypothetical protein n=1 Tax=Peptostreptococcus sp. TaxID=1262 RepID=UPI0025F85E73